MKHIAPGLLAVAAAIAGFTMVRAASGAAAEKEGETKRREIQGWSRTGGKETGRETQLDLSPGSQVGGASAVPIPSLRILDHFLADLTEDQLQRLLIGSFIEKASLKNSLLALFLASDNPSVHSITREVLLIGYTERDVISECTAAFEVETHRGRRLVLAEVIGASILQAEALESALGILSGNDVDVQLQLLKSLRFYLVGDDDKKRVAERLRELVMTGTSESLRVAAAKSLRSDNSPTGVRFLLDRALHEPLPTVRLAAVQSMSGHFTDEDRGLWEEVLSRLHAIFRDPACPEQIRRAATLTLEIALREYNGTCLTREQVDQVKSAASMYRKK